MSLVKNHEIVISKEIRDFIIPLNDEELIQLERNILKDGCRDPLIVWINKKDQLILIDGHNRYKICQKNNIPFKIKEIHFTNLDEAKIWMVDNQMGRRNLTLDQLSYYRGLKYLSLKRSRGGYENVKSKGKSETTSEFLSTQFNVSESTVKRDAKFAEGLNLIANSNPQLKARILSGEANTKKADIQVLSSSPDYSKITIKNEADLFNKAKKIREQLISEVENKVKDIEKKRIEKAQLSLKSIEPVFTSKDDKIKRIKGMIISAVSHAINDHDISSIKELKKLIDRLEDLLFD